jgi:hypothetical protein
VFGNKEFLKICLNWGFHGGEIDDDDDDDEALLGFGAM